MNDPRDSHDDLVRRIADPEGPGIDNDAAAPDYIALRKVWKRTAADRVEAPDVDVAWSQLSARLGLSRRRSATIWMLRTAVAASVVLAAVLVFWPRSSAPTELLADAGEQVSTFLPDGSSIELNSGSTASWVERDGERRLTLEGEAFLDVTSTGAPFVVETHNATVQVLGTRFNVHSRDGETRVFVEEGRVSVSAAAETVILNAMQAAAVRSGNGPALETGGLEASLAWRSGGFGFVRTDLGSVIAELERRFGQEIEIVTPELADRSVTATFPDMEVREVLFAICLTVGCTVEGEGPILVR